MKCKEAERPSDCASNMATNEAWCEPQPDDIGGSTCSPAEINNILNGNDRDSGKDSVRSWSRNLRKNGLELMLAEIIIEKYVKALVLMPDICYLCIYLLNL